jgi:hypothetical protein
MIICPNPFHSEAYCQLQRLGLGCREHPPLFPVESPLAETVSAESSTFSASIDVEYNIIDDGLKAALQNINSPGRLPSRLYICTISGYDVYRYSIDGLWL